MTLSPPAGWPDRLRDELGRIGPGFAVALTVAAAASFVSETYGGPVMLLALLLGMALNFLSEAGRCPAGIQFTSKRVLRIGIALLGLRIAASDVVALGLQTVELVVAGVVLTILSGVALARFVGRGARFGTLIGGATAICGASAALAIASVLPRRPESDRETIFVVVAVTTLSTIAMVIYPALFHALGFDRYQIGILVGATIHDVAQVVGAGYAVSDLTGDTGTVVKLFRVALLLPVVFIVSMLFARSRTGGETRQLPIPVFAIVFAALVVVNSFGIVPEAIREPLVGLSRWCLIAAVAAIGLSTSLKEIAKVGFPPVFVAVGTTIVLLVFTLAAVVMIAH
ncbi:YeiH family protein [Faunimonas sp. B44]|uniref:YeiH family protein n=1 Tax=Faunimonas sp. B44 TaxID=3461493 RepID=UPI004044D602